MYKIPTKQSEYSIKCMDYFKLLVENIAVLFPLQPKHLNLSAGVFVKAFGPHWIQMRSNIKVLLEMILLI